MAELKKTLVEIDAARKSLAGRQPLTDALAKARAEEANAVEALREADENIAHATANVKRINKKVIPSIRRLAKATVPATQAEIAEKLALADQDLKEAEELLARLTKDRPVLESEIKAKHDATVAAEQSLRTVGSVVASPEDLDQR